MRVTYAHLCDYAMISADRKPSMLGVFSRITAAKLPAVHPQSFLVFEIALDYTEVGQPIAIRVEVVDTDGNALLKAEASIPTHGTGKPGDNPTIPQILRLPPLPFQKAGRHEVNIFLGPGGGAAAHVPVDIVEASRPPLLSGTSEIGPA